MRALLAGVVLCGVTAAMAADAKPITVDLWPGKPPGEAVKGEEIDTTRPGAGRDVAGRRVMRLANVSKPTLTVYRPARGKETGTAVIVCPGGGYRILAWDLEGTEVCEWLNSIGVTAVLLKYRVPAGRVAPLQDAQRAVSVVRSRAKEWGIDPARIGMLGFSAGGHLTASASTNYSRRAYEPIDTVDKVSCKPDFAVLVYPAYLTTKTRDGLEADVRVTKDTPPAFLVHAGDDGVAAENSVFYYLALKKAGVPAELHVYPRGGHGYGLRRTDLAVTRWPERCAEWLRGRGLLRRAGGE